MLCWHGKTLSAIVGGIAGERGLAPDIDAVCRRLSLRTSTKPMKAISTA